MLFAQTTLELMTTGALLQELSWQYEYFWSVVTWFNLSTMISVGVNDFFGRKMSKAERAEWKIAGLAKSDAAMCGSEV